MQISNAQERLFHQIVPWRSEGSGSNRQGCVVIRLLGNLLWMEKADLIEMTGAVFIGGGVEEGEIRPIGQELKG